MIDVNGGKPCQHIQCAVGGSFIKQKFNPHWDFGLLKENYVANVDLLEDDHLHEGSPEDVVANNEFHSLPEECRAGYLQYFNDDIDPQYLPSNTASSLHRPVMRETRKTSTEKYNELMEECKQIGNIESQEKNALFKKVMTVMKYMRTNIQNGGN